MIVGKTKDAAAFHAAGEKWQTELRPGAKGYLGVTSGVADDATTFAIVRFETEADARANSDRPEQGAWWQETSTHYEGDPTFYDCPEVDLMGAGGSNDAGFVQVMIYRPRDVPALRKMNAEFGSLPDERPDIIGAATAFASDGTVIDTSYFTSEAEAREGEKKELSVEMQDAMRQFGENAGEIRFIDLRDPRFA